MACAAKRSAPKWARARRLFERSFLVPLISCVPLIDKRKERMMTDQAQPFKPKDVEQQVDQLSSSGRETYGNSPPDQRFLHDLRLVLAAQESDAQSQEQEDEGFLQHAWARIEGTGISPH